MTVMCLICKKVYSYQRTLNAHMRKEHQREPDANFEFNKYDHKCLEGCNVSFINIKNLRKHLEKEHIFILEHEVVKFSTNEEFTCWLMNLNNDCVQYLLTNSKEHRQNFQTSYYYCNRSGTRNNKPKVLPQNRKRSLKSQGTCKINASCTSVIIVVKCLQTGSLEVTYHKTHYGHEKEIQHIRISKSVHASIASKLISGVTINRVLEDNRQNLNSDKLTRKDLITKRDINNVKRRFHIDIATGVLHENDALSVDLWAEEYKKHNFLYYKKQGEEHPILGLNDICLIFMNISQELLLKSFGKKIICVDSTHGLNKYDFQLTTIMVIDDYGEGFPGACMFSNRIDTITNEIFFNVIKSRVGVISTQTFMTDITTTYLNAWEKVMGQPNFKLYCSWHVDRAWKSNLKKIRTLEKRTNVYKTLKYLQYTLNESDFLCDFKSTIRLLCNDEDTAEFGKYLQEHYFINCEKWAYCFRKNAGINTNMHIESMHKTIKYFYLEAKKVKRLDKGINALVSYIRNKIIERIIKNTKGLSSNHISEIAKRHKNFISSNFKIEFINNVWKVVDNKQTYFISNVLIPATSCCKLVCKECNICIHTYQCTCVDYCIKYSICEHIHSVVSFENKREISHIDNIIENNTEEIFVHLKTIGNVAETTSSAIISEVKNLASQFTSFDYEHTNKDVLLHVKKTLKNCFDFLASTDSIKNQNESFECNNNQVNEPPNKKIAKQKSFQSTKKKRYQKTERVSKPNFNESENVKRNLRGELYISYNEQNDHMYL